MKPTAGKFLCIVLNPREASLLRWLVKDALSHYPLTHRQREFVLPSLKKKLKP
jgi:hypothetical protein